MTTFNGGQSTRVCLDFSTSFRPRLRGRGSNQATQISVDGKFANYYYSLTSFMIEFWIFRW